MCGIAGFYRHDMPAERANERLALMASRLKHRGPDAHGALLRGDVGLAHARLAIVGIADGAQPMRTVEDDLAISFNGEIFNHVELRETLSARGHHFRTHSDTEVILHDYRDKGLDSSTNSTAILPSPCTTPATTRWCLRVTGWVSGRFIIRGMKVRFISHPRSGRFWRCRE